MNEQNRINLKTIESALMVYVFENENAEDLNEVKFVIVFLKNFS